MASAGAAIRTSLVATGTPLIDQFVASVQSLLVVPFQVFGEFQAPASLPSLPKDIGVVSPVVGSVYLTLLLASSQVKLDEVRLAATSSGLRLPFYTLPCNPALLAR